MSHPSLPSASELASQARAVLPKDFSLRLSPLLPAAWPPGSAASRMEVEWYVYRSEPLPSGVIAYGITGPVARVIIDVTGDAPRLDTLAGEGSLGTEREGSPAPELATAEQTLVEVLAGRLSLDSARPGLEGYLRWAEASSALGNDLRRRKPDFFRWLESGP